MRIRVFELRRPEMGESPAFPYARVQDFEDGQWELQVIQVPAHLRGRGYGSALLELVNAKADEAESDIMLTVGPGHPKTGGLSQDELYDWYERHGYVHTGPRMERFFSES